MEKIKRNDLIRSQPSLGDQLINIGVKEGVGLIGKLLDRGDKNKALAVILEKLDKIERMIKAQGLIGVLSKENVDRYQATVEAIDNRLKEIENELRNLRKQD